MKKFLYSLTCALMVIALPSCNFNKDNDEDVVPAEELLVGTWKMQSYAWTEKDNGKVTGSGTEIATDTWYTMLSFKADGSYIMMDVEDNESWEDKGTWMSSSNTLILRDEDGDNDTYTILSISKTKLVIRELDKYEYDGIKYEDTYDFTFTKN